MVWTLASICQREGGRGGLFKDFAIMMPASADWIEESAVAPLIIGGIVASSLSSALAALVGAPRVFQAVCKDPLFPILKPFAKGRGANEEPINAYCLTFCIAVGFMMIGSLNAIAPFITNFFMISYALINFAAFVADMSGSPGWRPTWKFYSPWVSLLGSVLCLGSMFMISWYVALVTLLVCYGLHSYVGHLKPDVDWGSVGSALTYRRTVEQLMALGRSKQEHVKNYRISCCVMAGVPGRRSDLVFFFDQLRGGGGLMVAGNVIRGNLESSAFISPLLTAHLNNNYYSENKFKAVQEVVVAPSLVQGARILLLTCGVGKLRPNLLGFGFREAFTDAQESKLTFDYVQALRDALRLNFSVAVLRNYTHERVGSREKAVDINEMDNKSSGSTEGKQDKATPTTPTMVTETAPGGGMTSVPAGSITNRTISINRRGSFHAGTSSHLRQQSSSKSTSNDDPSNFLTKKGRVGKIDVWWLDDTGGLTILLPHILRKKWHWKNCSIRVFVLPDGKNDAETQKQKLLTLLHGVRIKVESVTVVQKPNVREIDTANAQLAVERMAKDMSPEELEELMAINAGEGEITPDRDEQEIQADKQSDDERKELIKSLGGFKKSADRIAYKSAVGRLIKKECRDDTLLVVCTMSFPYIDVPAMVHMTSMDVQSKPCGKPFLFIRGTQKSILTMDS
jgi:solute carrier family 12 sodium/potassium/chloride transporter 2